MSVTTLIDIDFYYFRQKKIEVEKRIVVPLGQKIVWRFNVSRENERRFPSRENTLDIYLRVNIELYFEMRSPFSWQRKQTPYRIDQTHQNLSIEIASETADLEGEYKYGIRVEGEGLNDYINYDEDPYLIILRL